MSDDPYNLQRFVDAQDSIYAQALSEIRGGWKLSHWMWFIFPQFQGLGSSATTQFYSIKSREEAEAYLRHPLLGLRLLECAEAALSVEGRTAGQIFGPTDERKLRSCATLFSTVSPEGSVFHRLLDRFYAGRRDARTLELLDRDEDVS